ncbi:MAG TPA: hypothetical protein VIM08_06600, partial [Arthrobacter sp.]
HHVGSARPGAISAPTQTCDSAPKSHPDTRSEKTVPKSMCLVLRAAPTAHSGPKPLDMPIAHRTYS